MGAYRAAAELGLSIPEDLFMVGFDDHELIAGSLHPGLTTVALPHYGMGAWAANRLIDTDEAGDPGDAGAGSEDRPACYAHRELLLFAMRDVLRTVYS